MATRSFPFVGSEAPEGDYYRLHNESGVVRGLNLTFSGLTAQVSTGIGMCRGSMYLVEDQPESRTSPPAGSLPRRDALVSRRRLTTGTGSALVPGKTTIELITGTPAATPATPAWAQDDTGVWEELLYSWTVPANGGTVVTAVQDNREPLHDNSSRKIGYAARRQSAAIGPASGIEAVAGLSYAFTLSTAYVVEAVFSGQATSNSVGALVGVGVSVGDQVDSVRIGTVPIVQANAGHLFTVTHEVTLPRGQHNVRALLGPYGGGGAYLTGNNDLHDLKIRYVRPI
jgi:hypothetical protein